MDNLNEHIFKLNNIILSALNNTSNIRDELIKENEKLSEFVGNSLKGAYNKILNGCIPQISAPDEPKLETAMKYSQEKRFPYAFYEFVRLSKKEPKNIKYMKCAAVCLEQMQAYKVLLKYYLPFFEKYIDQDDEMLELTALVYAEIEDYYAKAIPMYEKIIQKNTNVTFDHYMRLAILYERVYQDKNLDIQIKYAQKALETTHEMNETLVLLAKLYYRAGKINEYRECFNKILSNNPSADDIVAFGSFLINEGKIKEGFDKYRLRFDTMYYLKGTYYPKPLTREKHWDGVKDISNSTVIVHFEQGFGDSVMFSRYIPALSAKAGKIIFVVQKNFLSLFKSSGYEKYCTLFSHEAGLMSNLELPIMNYSMMYGEGKGIEKIPYDYHIPLMDLPYLMNESPARMSESGGYLIADKDKIEIYRKKYIKDDGKFKIGFAYHGTKQSNQTYRDIPARKFIPFLKMKGIDCYSLQAGEFMKELEDLPEDVKMYNLGKDFKDFENTACAMNCMDLIITTDNVIMNLAGALGLKTYGLFNVYPEHRWYKTQGDDVGWYKSVRPFRVETFNDWDNLILEVKEHMLKDFPALKD